MPTHVLDLLLQLPRGPLLRPLEDHVLQKMRCPIGLVRLEPRASVDPDTDGGRLGGEVGFGGDAEAVREGGDPGLRGGEDTGEVGGGRVGRRVLEETRVRVLELLQLGLHGQREAVVDHSIWGRRRGRDRRRSGYGGRGRRGSNGLAQKGRGLDGGSARPSGYSAQQVLNRHGSDGALVSANSLLF